jgi:di/tripeptidase
MDKPIFLNKPYLCTSLKKYFMQHIIDRFISYVTVDTESDPNSETTPSTAKQWISQSMVEELKK